LRAWAAVATPSIGGAAQDHTGTGSPVKGTRPAYCFQTRQMQAHMVYDRYALRPGMRLEGRAIIEERESTTIIGVGGNVLVDAMGTLVIALDGDEENGNDA
jgi:N-methylhydantoinase A/oxoprolinase/acetone carboxylase beta subunit